ncbi:VOC family protein [Nocardioides panacisoli]|uniref:VOC family protein n=1 Tax=Nocardioides panacisoli TaxID=627624 RepID=A0ABP7IZC9_9ACTN
MAIARDPYFVLDCPDAAALAEFYAALLGWKAGAGPDSDWASVKADDGSGRAFFFQEVDDYRAPDWPGQEVPQQMHLDVDVDDLDAGEEAVLAIGARKHDHQPGTTFRVFLDPAGHPFCLCLAG